MLTQTLRSRWFALGLHAALWVLLVLALGSLGGRGPRYAEAPGDTRPRLNPIPVERIRTLFDMGTALRGLTTTNGVNPFFTRYFLPPTLPKPTTRKVELTYHGYYQTTEGPPTAMLNVDDALVVGAPGAKAVANLFVAGITWQTLTLTNPAAQTNLLPLNVKKDVEVPIP